MREALRTIENGPQITYLSDMEMGALLERLKRLPENSVVLYATITQDAAGRHFVNSDQSLPMVPKRQIAPSMSCQTRCLVMALWGDMWLIMLLKARMSPKVPSKFSMARNRKRSP